MGKGEMTEEIDALVIGAGPAGLMAAEVLEQAGRRVVIAEAKPSPARKLLMAGKSGLNLTKAEPEAAFLAGYAEAAEWLSPMLTAFGQDGVRTWAEGLGQELFTGSSGRVFPRSMKASPLLRAWLGRLTAEMRLRWRGMRRICGRSRRCVAVRCAEAPATGGASSRAWPPASWSGNRAGVSAPRR